MTLPADRLEGAEPHDLLDWLRKEAERFHASDPTGAMILLSWAREIAELREERSRLRSALKGAGHRLQRIKRTAKASSAIASRRTGSLRAADAFERIGLRAAAANAATLAALSSSRAGR